MKRTVKGTKYTYAKAELINGNIVTKQSTNIVLETDRKKAREQLAANVGDCVVIKTEDFEETTYIADDLYYALALKDKEEAEALADKFLSNIKEIMEIIK